MAAILLIVGLSGCISQPGVAAAGINTGGNNPAGSASAVRVKSP